MRSILISDAELDDAIFRNACQGQCRDSLSPPSLRVIVPRLEAGLLRIAHVGGCAVRNMNDMTFPKMRQQRPARTNNFIVRMRNDEHHTRLRFNSHL